MNGIRLNQRIQVQVLKQQSSIIHLDYRGYMKGSNFISVELRIIEYKLSFFSGQRRIVYIIKYLLYYLLNYNVLELCI